jgi:ketosteroid isomerase-like protein
MAHPNEDVVREAFAAFGRGDIDALRNQYFAEDIRWHIPGRGPLAGDYDGIARVMELFGRILELSGGTFRNELHDVVANDEHAVALYGTAAEREGRRLDDNNVSTFHIRDGKIAEVWTQVTDMYATDEFWS